MHFQQPLYFQLGRIRRNYRAEMLFFLPQECMVRIQLQRLTLYMLYLCVTIRKSVHKLPRRHLLDTARNYSRTWVLSTIQENSLKNLLKSEYHPNSINLRKMKKYVTFQFHYLDIRIKIECFRWNVRGRSSLLYDS